MWASLHAFNMIFETVVCKPLRVIALNFDDLLAVGGRYNQSDDGLWIEASVINRAPERKPMRSSDLSGRFPVHDPRRPAHSCEARLFVLSQPGDRGHAIAARAIDHNIQHWCKHPHLIEIQ